MSTHENQTRPGAVAAWRWMIGPALLAAFASTLGCSRAYYRLQADADVNAIIDDKSIAVGTSPGQFRIDVDPRSRMYDPSTNPDSPPMPPDDPVSHQLMHCVDCMPGSPCLLHAAKTPFTENPHWEDYLPRDEEGRVVLDLPGAMQLALLQSTSYQSQLETLYLSSLDVTFERFRFDSQFFGGSEIFFTSGGRNRSGGNSSSLLQVVPLRPANRLRVEKLTATGGELVVGLANSLMWQFAGRDNYSSTTLLDFSLVQPLLRAGGRTRVLERLTISERALLANVRQMEQYRQGFYLNVTTGRGPGQGPNRRGGFFGGSGLEGFAGVGGGGFGQVGGFGGQGLGQGGGVTGGAGAQQAGGYIGLLQSAQVIRNQYANIAELSDSVDQLQAANEAGRIDRFQVDLARQALYNAQSQLLNSVAQYESSLDNFKVQHGLPPDLKMLVSDPMLDHFNLLDPNLSVLQTQVTDVLLELRERREPSDVPAAQQPPGAEPELAADDAVVEISPERLLELAAEAYNITAASQQQLAVAQENFRQLQEVLPQRRETLARLARRDEVRNGEIDATLFSVERLDDRVASLANDMVEMETQLHDTWSRLDSLTGDTTSPPEQFQSQLTSALTKLSGELLELSLLQARARLDAVTFDPLELSPEQAFCIAGQHRRDWMNARAALVDSWRLIHFNADDLQSDLDLVFSGDLGNVGDNPLRFRGTNGRLRVGLQFDAPLTRLSERNTYRQSLIEYQQARRTYYRFRDRIKQQLRGTLRQMRLDQLNFELRRAAIHVAITQVDLARLRLSEPARPVSAAAPGQPLAPGGQSQFGDTVARDLVNALVDLLNVQNDFLSVWVDHEVQRLNLDFQLGIMELDSHGQRMEHNQPLEAFLADSPCAVPCECPDPCDELAPAGDPGPRSILSIESLPAEESGDSEMLPSPGYPPSDAQSGEVDVRPMSDRSVRQSTIRHEPSPRSHGNVTLARYVESEGPAVPVEAEPVEDAGVENIEGGRSRSVGKESADWRPRNPQTFPSRTSSGWKSKAG